MGTGTDVIDVGSWDDMNADPMTYVRRQHVGIAGTVLRSRTRGAYTKPLVLKRSPAPAQRILTSLVHGHPSSALTSPDSRLEARQDINPRWTCPL